VAKTMNDNKAAQLEELLRHNRAMEGHGHHLADQESERTQQILVKLAIYHRCFAVGSTRFFVVFFFVFIFVFMSMPIFVLAFIAAQMAVATTFSPRVESFTVMRLCASTDNEYLIRRVSLGEIVTPRIRNVVFAACRIQRIYALIISG